MDAFESLREHCLGLKGAAEVFQWGAHVYKVYGKVFALVGDGDGLSVSLKADPAAREALLTAPHIRPAPYMHHNGWINVAVREGPTLEEAKELIATSHALILAKIPKARRTAE
jgi:predicted DNA-binding protein (MmcQ/YjbR family)